MSDIGLMMNGLLGVLLVGALVLGWRLEQRLKTLRASHDSFTQAVGDLDRAAARAEQGLADLRAATDEAVDLLADRIDKGRALAAKLERLIDHAAVPQRVRRRVRRVDEGDVLLAEQRRRPDLHRDVVGDVAGRRRLQAELDHRLGAVLAHRAHLTHQHPVDAHVAELRQLEPGSVGLDGHRRDRREDLLVDRDRERDQHRDGHHEPEAGQQQAPVLGLGVVLDVHQHGVIP